jgi:NAD(P)-dependent dehydrogenase (short-subunit alcohol dehydrogenase family)
MSDGLKSVKAALDLTGRVAIITGGAGLLGRKHAEAIAEMGGIPVLVDLRGDQAEASAKEIGAAFGVRALGLSCDITKPEMVREVLSTCLTTFGSVEVLINNAANDPKLETKRSRACSGPGSRTSRWMCGAGTCRSG